MPRRLVQQRMTLTDLEWPFHGSASRAISAVAEFFVCFVCVKMRLWTCQFQKISSSDTVTVVRAEVTADVRMSMD